MAINPDHIDFLMARDGEVADGAESALCAILRMRDYLQTHKLQVKAFFAGVKSIEGTVSLYMSAESWEARMSNAAKVLSTFGDKGSDLPMWVTTMTALHVWNDDRVTHGDRVTWSLQAIYAACGGKSTAGKPVTATVTEPEVTVVAEPVAKTDQLSVILAALPNLTVAELGTLAAAVAQERTRKSTLVIVPAA